MIPPPGWKASDTEGVGSRGKSRRQQREPLCLPPELSPEAPTTTPPCPEPAGLLAHGAGRDAVLGALDLEVEAVAPDGPGVVVEADAAPLPGHEALGHAVAHDPAADPARGRVDGRVLEAPRAV